MGEVRWEQMSATVPDETSVVPPHARWASTQARFARFARGRLDTPRGWVPPAVVAAGWTLWGYVRMRPPAGALANHLAAYRLWAYQHLAYSDLLGLYRSHALYNHGAPYIHTAIEYPVVTGLFMWGAAWFPGVQGYLLASALGIGACVVGCVWVLFRSSPKHAWIFALSPLLLVYTLLNWDILAIALMLGGWLAFRQRRDAVAGVLFALGVFAKLYPVVLLLFCVAHLFAERADPTERRRLRNLVVSASITALVVNLPFALANSRNWLNFFTFNAERHSNSGVLNELHIVAGWPVAGVDALTALLGGAVAAFFIWRVVQRRMPPEVAAAITLASGLLLNKTFSPQYMLWIFVVALLAEWPTWTYPGLIIAGLVDFANAMITFSLDRTHPAAWTWYWGHVFHLNLALRNTAIATALVGALWASRRQWLPIAGSPTPPAEPRPHRADRSRSLTSPGAGA